MILYCAEILVMQYKKILKKYSQNELDENA